MKLFTTYVVLLILSVSAFAQITLNQSSAPVVGQTASDHAGGTLTFDCTSGSGNINWDITPIAFGSADGIQYVDPSSTPFAASFPSAEVAATIDGSGSWSYMRTTSEGMWYLGFATEVGGGFINIPDDDELVVPFPCTYNTTWSSVIRISLEPVPGFVTVTIDSTYNVANAWGNLITPSWTESALRVLGHGFTASYLNGQQIGATTETWDYQFITSNPLRGMSFSNSGATGPG